MVGEKCIVSLLLLICLVAVIEAEKISSSQIKQLTKWANEAPIIKMNSDNYKRFVMEGDRNYTILTLFTATHQKFNCGPCKTLAEEYEAFGDSYKRHFGNLKSEEFLGNPLFMVQMEPEEDGMEIFQHYGFKTVPHFAVIRPSKAKHTTIAESDYFRNPSASADDISGFVGNAIDVHIPIYKSPVKYYLTILAALMLIATTLRLGFMIRHKLQDPMTWFVITMGLYFIVMAGIAYNFIRTPAWADYHNGRVQYISPQARTQYVSEGFIIATLMTSTGLLFVGIGDFIPRITNSSKQRFAFWVCCAGLFITLSMINNIFFQKYHLPAFRLHTAAAYFGV